MMGIQMGIAANEDAPQLLGALLGWKRFPSPHGSILRLQAAATLADAKSGRFNEFDLVLNLTQLRRLAVDLSRAADEQEDRIPELRRAKWKMFR